MPSNLSIHEVLAQNVARRMTELGLKQKEIATMMEVDSPRISEIINAKANPELSTIDKLASALLCSAADLLTRDQ